jgi:hypothetical protein
MLLVSSATMMPTTTYPEGQYQCLRNHIRSTAFRTRTRDGRINGGLSTDLYVCIAESFGCPVERVLHGMDGEVPRSGVLLDLSTEGALEAGVAGPCGLGRPWARDAPEVESMSTSVPGDDINCQCRGTAALCIGSILATSARCVGDGTAA